jgi:hypothetical protein
LSRFVVGAGDLQPPLATRSPLEVLLHGGNTVGGWTAKHLVGSKYPSGRDQFMMDLPHARQQIGSALGVRHRSG